MLKNKFLLCVTICRASNRFCSVLCWKKNWSNVCVESKWWRTGGMPFVHGTFRSWWSQFFSLHLWLSGKWKKVLVVFIGINQMFIDYWYKKCQFNWTRLDFCNLVLNTLMKYQIVLPNNLYYWSNFEFFQYTICWKCEQLSFIIFCMNQKFN